MEIRHQVWWFSSRTSFSRPWWRLVRETPWWMVGEWIAVIVIHWSQLAEYTYPIMNWLLFSIDYFFGLIIAFTVIVCTLCYWLLFLFMLSSLSSVSCQKGLQAFFFLIAGHRRFVPGFHWFWRYADLNARADNSPFLLCLFDQSRDHGLSNISEFVCIHLAWGTMVHANSNLNIWFVLTIPTWILNRWLPSGKRLHNYGKSLYFIAG